MTPQSSLRAATMLALAAMPPVASPAIAAPPNAFAQFFSGRTEGAGRLKIMMRRAVDVRVKSVGRIDRDGTLVLSQVVNEGAKPARSRTWRVRELSPGRFAGTLSDARGPVTGEVAGGRLHLAFTGTDGNGYQQWISFAADGRSARNTLTVRKYGMNVATLEETIRKLD